MKDVLIRNRNKTIKILPQRMYDKKIAELFIFAKKIVDSGDQRKKCQTDIFLFINFN